MNIHLIFVIVLLGRIRSMISIKGIFVKNWTEFPDDDDCSQTDSIAGEYLLFMIY